MAATPQLDINQIEQMLRTRYNFHVRPGWKGFIWTDRYYRSVSLSELQAAIRTAVRAAKILPWNGEAGDCDGAAMVFKAEMVKASTRNRGETQYPVWIISMADANRNNVHAMVMAIDENMEPWLIDPRVGEPRHMDEFPDLMVYWFFG